MFFAYFAVDTIRRALEIVEWTDVMAVDTKQQQLKRELVSFFIVKIFSGEDKDLQMAFAMAVDDAYCKFLADPGIPRTFKSLFLLAWRKVKGRGRVFEKFEAMYRSFRLE